MLFLLAGNILARYHTFSSYDVRGLRHESLTRGVNIVKYIYSDGSVKVEKKVI